VSLVYFYFGHPYAKLSGVLDKRICTTPRWAPLTSLLPPSPSLISSCCQAVSQWNSGYTGSSAITSQILHNKNTTQNIRILLANVRDNVINSKQITSANVRLFTLSLRAPWKNTQKRLASLITQYFQINDIIPLLRITHAQN